MEHIHVILLKDDGIEFSTVWKGPTSAEEALQQVIDSYSEKDFKKVEWIKVYKVEKESSAGFERTIVNKTF